MITGAAQAHHHGEDRRHAGSCGDGLLCPFQRRDALFEGAHRRVGIAGVNVTRHFASKARRRVRRGAEHVAGGEEHRVTVFTFRRAVLAGAHSQGIESHTIEVAVQPTGIPFLTHAATPSLKFFI